MRLAFAVLSAALVLGPLSAPLSASAQALTQTVASSPLDAAAVVGEVRRIIDERYVLPERRPALDAVLAEGLSSGRYAVADPVDLAERINADLERVGHDRHLSFRYDVRGAEQLMAQGPGDIDKGEPGDFSAYEHEVRAANHGVTDLRILPGNVRLMRYDGFHYIGAETDQALTDAMRFLSGGDAVIIDLRTNGGGSPEAVRQIVSRFLAAGTPLVTFYMNGAAEPDDLVSLPDPLVARMVGKPLYVLTSGGTASAAEEFTGHVLGYRIGEVVGENTAGAGFRNEIVPVAGQFLFSVSVGRAVLASTGKDWEAVGHAPTIAAPVASAQEVAQIHALRRLAEKASGRDRAELEALAEGVDARMTPRAPGRSLAAYLGRFGERVVRVEGERLIYQRGERAPIRLIALGGDRFVSDTDPATVFVFEGEAGAINALSLSHSGEVQGWYARSSE
jgi:hypothetical protein